MFPGSDYQPTAEEAREFDEQFHRRLHEEQQAASRDGKTKVIWSPQPGSQQNFMACPHFEALIHGTRGGGKTDVLLMAFAQHVGKGHGEAWRGVIFRQTYPQLGDITAKSIRWFRQIFPQAKFSRSTFTWEWPTGEVLMFRHMDKPSDYWNYHGHELPFIGFEELTNWPTSECYTPMFACCRASKKGVPRMVRANTNPYGPGHSWVKDRFRLYGKWWRTIIIDDEEQTRVAIHSHLSENKILLEADPKYEKTITAAASNEAMKEAWLRGDWSVTAGGMFDDLWSEEHNIVPNFDPPSSWRIDRSFDWGSARPFAVGWWAESDGTDLDVGGLTIPTVRRDLFLWREWYGWSGHPNTGCRMLAVDVAKGIVERQLAWGIHHRVRPGPADSEIYAVQNRVSIATDMKSPVRIGTRIYPGITWIKANKRPGSRKQGAEIMRKLIKQAHPNEDNTPREKPGLFVVGEECRHFLRTVPSLPRDEKDPDDVDDEAEDHIYDMSRYRCFWRFRERRIATVPAEIYDLSRPERPL